MNEIREAECSELDDIIGAVNSMAFYGK